METEKQTELAGQFDFLLQVGIPPDVIDIGGDADDRIADRLTHLPGLGHPVDAALVSGIHRMQRFDRQLYTRLLRIRNQCRDSFGDLFAGIA